jgi:hypothetical protein
MKRLMGLLVILSAVLLCISCFTAIPSEPEIQQQGDSLFTQCEDPRAEACTREYNPVCAIRNTGVQCITTPCPSMEEITYATGCTACADDTVIKYTLGACKS